MVRKLTYVSQINALLKEESIRNIREVGCNYYDELVLEFDTFNIIVVPLETNFGPAFDLYKEDKVFSPG